MSSSDFAVKVNGLSKRYEIYKSPGDRLKQFIFPRLLKLFGSFEKIYFSEFWALKDVSFEIKKGETLGIIGRNGSGKSTLLQLICGTLTPTSGEIETNGRIAALLELGSGFNPEFTGRENIFMNASVLGLSSQEIVERFEDIVSFAEIGEFIDQPVKTYSSGMMLRLAFAVIAHVDADILIIDEAMAVGDAFFTQKCMRFLRNFLKTGTILFVSHDTASIRNLCTKAIWLEKGRTLQMGHPKEVCDRYLESSIISHQGDGPAVQMKQKIQNSLLSEKDLRQDFLKTSNLRNDIKLFSFDPDAPSFGRGGAQIDSVRFLDSSGDEILWIVGGEEVNLRINVLAKTNIESAIIGFTVKDKLGQALFGDNTWLTYMDSPVSCQKDQFLTADFVFQMPRLPTGNYSISVAIADGTQHEHIQHHWFHDAIFFKSESTSVAAGLIGIPMRNIKIGTTRSL